MHSKRTVTCASTVLWAFLLIFVASVGMGCACNPAELMGGDQEASNDEPEDGDKKSKKKKKKSKIDAEELYAEHCEGCHGENGDEDPDFTDPDYKTSKKKIIKAISKGKGSMPGFKKKLDKDEIKALASFVREFNDSKKSKKKKKKKKSKKKKKWDKELAQSLFAEHCAGCHGEKGNKNPDFTDDDYDASTKSIIKAIDKGKGAMPGFGKKLDDNEIEHLAWFIGQL